MTNVKSSQDDFLRTEYTALARYFGTVITFRFTTAAFFIAAVALVLGINQPTPAHHVLLFAISLGIWIVELRNRSVFENLLRRAWRIEEAWARPNDGQLPLFQHMAPIGAAKEGHSIPESLRKYDQSRILWFGHYFSARHISHTLGFDILYLSVMAYSVWSLRSVATQFLGGQTMDPVLALFAFGIIVVGYRAIRAGAAVERRAVAALLAIIGTLLILAAGALVWFKAA